MNALVGDPYKVFNHYVVPQRWTPRFNPAKATVEKMTVWVRLPGLPVELFRDDTIKQILRQVGTPVKLDRTTTGVDQGHFARAAVEVDLKKPLTSMIIVDDWIQQVEFEGLHTICFGCGEVGHRSNVCPKNKQVAVDQPEQQAASPMEQTETIVNTPSEPTPEMRRYGQWMIVQNKHAKQGKQNKKSPPKVTQKEKGKALSQPPNTSQKDKGKAPAQSPNMFSALQEDSVQLSNGDIPPASEREAHGGLTNSVADAGKSAATLDLNNTNINFGFQSESHVDDNAGMAEKVSSLGTKKANGRKGRKRTDKVNVQNGVSNISPVDKSLANSGAGVKSGGTRRHARELLKRSEVGALCFLETKTKEAGGLLNMADKLGFCSSFMVDPLGFAGGLLLVWNKDRVPLTVVGHNSQSIHTLIPRHDGKNFRISFAYVRPTRRAKDLFWQGCKEYSNSFKDPWVMLGDFNDISGQADQWGVGEIVASSVDRFLEAVNDCGLMDLGTSRSRFSWYRKVGERVTLRRKLDRVLWNMEAQLFFPKGKAHILPCTHSDHHPIQFDSVAGSPPPRKERPFRKRNTLARIAGIQATPNYGSDMGLMKLKKTFIDNLHDILKQEEVFWHQKSRKDWIQDGDRNTTFYHRATLVRRNRARVTMLKVNGEWISNPQIIKEHITNFFKCLVGRNQDDIREAPTFVSGRAISDRQAQSLIRLTTVNEVRQAVFGMKRFGSPGPDGIQAAFYRHYWDIVGDSVTHFVNSCLTSGTIPSGMLEAYMTLIPKKENPENAGDFRPITLLNVIFKIVSKVLVNRLKPIMKKMVGPFQNSFLPGRSTLDNVVLTQEVIHNMTKAKGKKGFMVLKLDIHKAYDSLDWGFLEAVLSKFNFPSRLISLIMFSLKESTISINWNGGKLPAFGVGRGVRQGDPLAPYLFILAMETLSWAIQEEVNSGRWKPYKVARGGSDISHLFFADDLILFGEASEQQLRSILSVVDKVKRRLGEVAGIPVSDNMGKYLGIPILHKRVSKDSFAYILEKMKKRLSGWKRDSLSLAGRRILTQSALATIPVYTMQALALPKGTCDNIDKICRDFLWGDTQDKKKIHLVNWDEVCQPRDSGGLGLRKASHFNDALLAKLAWQMCGNSDKLWVKVMRDKYVKQGEFFSSSVPGNASWAWKSIIRGRRTVISNAVWKVGDGRSINVWTDWWVGNIPLGLDQNVVVPEGLESCMVSDFIFPSRTWDLPKLQEILLENIINNIRAIPITLNDRARDSIGWTNSELGKFTTKSAYSCVAGIWKLNCWNMDGDNNDWEWIWKLNCWEKIKVFIWLILKGRLLTNVERFRRHIAESNSCPCCGSEEESLRHLFWECGTTQVTWKLSDTPPDFSFPIHWTKCLDVPTSKEHSSSNCALGGLVRDSTGRLVWGFTTKIGKANSFVAELWGLREGLWLCLEKGVLRVMVEMDSKAIIDLLHGEDDADDSGCTLLHDCVDLVPRFEGISFNHTFREGNACADFLANLAQEKDWGTSVFTNAMEVLQDFQQ
ncbi:PREDICTED: uncharacterized protein LOC109154684 [Ipomoea nil]|uniref:uncharacterized protein LOC109154684 n=1 Tax=Ipomoea nil TaxID=35883 RepID=UPI000901BF56|nr:PREDICTED: uncharacterized protein LOC109154684 [Ipomoea nil]